MIALISYVVFWFVLKPSLPKSNARSAKKSASFICEQRAVDKKMNPRFNFVTTTHAFIDSVPVRKLLLGYARIEQNKANHVDSGVQEESSI